MLARVSARSDAVDFVSQTLLLRASRLTRLLLRFGSRELTRTESGLLLTLLDGPRRITELAESEALAQPTVTQLVDKLQRRGLVSRARDAADGRAVLVSISADGRARLDAVLGQFRIQMRQAVEGLDDEELVQLVAASQTLARLIEILQSPASSP